MTRAPPTPHSPDQPGNRGGATLRELVDDYLRRKNPCHDEELARYRAIPSLDQAIQTAALSEIRDGKRHNHQRRIPQAALEEAAERLSRAGLDSSSDFDNLLGRVAAACEGINGIGPLTIYDVAFRIGVYLRKLPERVYLHAGTREGARALHLGYRQDTLETDELPPELRRLQPWQVEDFLCVYKGRFGDLASPDFIRA